MMFQNDQITCNIQTKRSLTFDFDDVQRLHQCSRGAQQMVNTYGQMFTGHKKWSYVNRVVLERGVAIQLADSSCTIS